MKASTSPKRQRWKLVAPKVDYQLTAHALAVIAERGMDIAWMERVLESDGRVLRVVYNESIIPLRVVTAYFDRRQRGRT